MTNNKFCLIVYIYWREYSLSSASIFSFSPIIKYIILGYFFSFLIYFKLPLFVVVELFVVESSVFGVDDNIEHEEYFSKVYIKHLVQIREISPRGLMD